MSFMKKPPEVSFGHIPHITARSNTVHNSDVFYKKYLKKYFGKDSCSKINYGSEIKIGNTVNLGETGHSGLMNHEWAVSPIPEKGTFIKTLKLTQ